MFAGMRVMGTTHHGEDHRDRYRVQLHVIDRCMRRDQKPSNIVTSCNGDRRYDVARSSGVVPRW
jgi:hypothetical protein